MVSGDTGGSSCDYAANVFPLRTRGVQPGKRQDDVRSFRLMTRWVIVRGVQNRHHHRGGVATGRDGEVTPDRKVYIEGRISGLYRTMSSRTRRGSWKRLHWYHKTRPPSTGALPDIPPATSSDPSWDGNFFSDHVRNDWADAFFHPTSSPYVLIDSHEPLGAHAAILRNRLASAVKAAQAVLEVNRRDATPHDLDARFFLQYAYEEFLGFQESRLGWSDLHAEDAELVAAAKRLLAELP